jgi:ubiquinone biosynthesis protein
MSAISRSQRYRRIVTVLVEEGFGTGLDQVGVRAPWIAALLLKRRAQEDANLTPEQRVRRTMERLGPTFAKIGQLLSVRRDLIPGSFADELARLQDEMEAFPFAEAKAEIEESFGQPLEELYAEFDEVPAAAASIGQVHMAVLHDGTRVAVKVQRPGIREVVEADLDILRTQARRIHGRTDIGRRFDVVALADEFARILHEECDYVNEAENADRLRAAFHEDETVRFPRVYWDLTSATVLTMDRIDGIPFNRLAELDARGVDRHEIARRGISCYYEQIFIHGFYHADPHPGNLFAMEDGRVAFTDFGRAGVLSDSARAHVADLLVAIIGQDGELAGDILLEVSRSTADTDAVGLKRDVTNLIRKYYNLKLNEVDTRELVFEIMSLIGRRGLTLDSEFALLLTTLATVQSLGTNVDPEFHFVESVTPFARRIIEEQTNPANMAKGFTATVRRTMKALQGLPDNVNRALKRVADGDLRMTVRPGGFDPIMARVEQAVDRLAFALVVSAFVLGFSWLLAPTVLPWWLEAIAAFALVCAAGVGVWFFLSIVFRRWRQRRHEQ